MAKCLNCGRNMSCGCQRRVASDGKPVCASCKAAYEAKIKGNKANVTPNVTPMVTRVSVTRK